MVRVLTINGFNLYEFFRVVYISLLLYLPITHMQSYNRERGRDNIDRQAFVGVYKYV